MTRFLRPASLALALLLPSQSFALDNLSYVYSQTPDDETKALLERDSVLAQARKDDNTEPQELLAAARADYARLIGILNARGRYAGQVSILVDGKEAYDLSPFEAPDEIKTIEVQVTPGPKFRISSFEVSPLPERDGVLDLPQGGDLAESGKITKAVADALEAWRSHGYADAQIKTQDIVADHESHKLRARIVIEPGDQYRFGTLSADPDDPTDPTRVIAAAALPEGDIFDPNLVEEAQTRLQRTGAYRSVSLEERPDPKTKTMGIAANLVPEKKRRLTAGAEFASPGGLSLSAGWMHRNFRQDLQTLTLESGFENLLDGPDQIDFSLGATLERPAFMFPDTDLKLSSGLDFLQEPTYDSQSIEFGASLIHDFGNGLTTEVGTSLGFTMIQDDLGDRSTTDLSFPLSATFDQSDDPLDPKVGYRIALTATPILLLEEKDVASQFTFDARRYQSFGKEENTTIAARLQGGSMVGAGYEDVPPDMLFSSGGGGTVRGVGYKSLAVTRAPGVETGGSSFLGASLELRQQVWGEISGVLFADAGWVGKDVLPSADDPWHAGAGFGVRYNTPVGPARLDIAFPVEGDRSSPFQLYLGIGQSF